MRALLDGAPITLQLPDAQDYVLPGVRWGRLDHLFTPAFWLCRTWYDRGRLPGSFRLGNDLTEEVVACLLGGHGLRAEVAIAAFHRLRESSLLFYERDIEATIHGALTKPLRVGDRHVRYRYPAQRARFIARALKRLSAEKPPIYSDVALRSWLATFDGIGLKTASWITRNYLESDNVAILDVHVFRAGVLAKVFESKLRISVDYRTLESRLIEFALALGVRLSVLDAVIWAHMRVLNRLGMRILSTCR